ncbi:MAG TPA: hypothetical protein VN799_09630, partial [Acidimicrobiales bacterium]|nr:hypothetical protein [Acidimicrobiales bacterium]
MQSFIARVETFAGATNADGGPLPLELLVGEHALLVLPFVQLIQPRRLPSAFVGGNSGFLFHVAGGEGSGEEEGEPTPIDSGVVTVTDQRAVFSGSLHTRTWDYSAVIGYHSSARPPWTAIAVRDRQTVSGVRYDPTHAEEFRFALALGLARFHGEEASLVEDLNRQLADLDRRRPHALPVAPPGGVTSHPPWAPATEPEPVVAATTGTGA